MILRIRRRVDDVTICAQSGCNNPGYALVGAVSGGLEFEFFICQRCYEELKSKDGITENIINYVRKEDE